MTISITLTLWKKDSSLYRQKDVLNNCLANDDTLKELDSEIF